MVDLPKKRVGIVACSGEELAEGTVTRLAALRVLEQLRPDDTVTICLPLFLAGGEGDRAFARFYPTIAVDGCELRCAARATEMYSGKPAAGLVVSELLAELGLAAPHDRRRLDPAGLAAVEVTADRVAEMVDDLLEKPWSRRSGQFITLEEVSDLPRKAESEAVQATCSCGSGIPVQQIVVEGQALTIVALPLIFDQLHRQGKTPSEATGKELLETVNIYNSLPKGQEEACRAVLLGSYAEYWEKKRATP
jgi:uncharacterized metal-binding protein